MCVYAVALDLPPLHMCERKKKVTSCTHLLHLHLFLKSCFILRNLELHLFFFIMLLVKDCFADVTLCTDQLT